MSTDVQILQNYTGRIAADQNNLSGLSISDLLDMRTVALRLMAAVQRGAEEDRKYGLNPNDNPDLLNAGALANHALSLVGRVTLTSELSKRSVQTAFQVTKLAVTTGLPFTIAALAGAAATFLRMGGTITVPFFGSNFTA